MAFQNRRGRTYNLGYNFEIEHLVSQVIPLYDVYFCMCIFFMLRNCSECRRIAYKDLILPSFLNPGSCSSAIPSLISNHYPVVTWRYPQISSPKFRASTAPSATGVVWWRRGTLLLPLPRALMGPCRAKSLFSFTQQPLLKSACSPQLQHTSMVAAHTQTLHIPLRREGWCIWDLLV